MMPAAALERRRLALRAALHAGDPVVVARAAARARLPGVELGAAELRRARVARRRLGRAIRVARIPEAAPIAEPAGSFTVARRRVRRWPRVVALAALAVIIVGLVARPAPAQPAATTTPPTPAPTLVPFSDTAGGGTPGTPLSRGRVISAVARPVPTPTPAPTATPSPSPSPKPSASAVAGVPGATASGAPGGGGSGGGTGGGGSGPSGAPYYTPGPLQPGMIRIVGRVVDSVTRQPLSGVCVRLGFGCVPLQPYTDPYGIFTLDIPSGSGGGSTITWDFSFERAGYVTANVRITPQTWQRFIYLGTVLMTAQ